jgi:hypothetical protein
MDSVLGWLFALALVSGGLLWFVKACIDSYEQYLYNRRHGWQ